MNLHNMNVVRKYKSIVVLLTCLLFAGCTTFTPVRKTDAVAMPQSYSDSKDSTNSAQLKWKDFFADKNLVTLIDTALKNNFDLLITLQDIEIARNDVRLRKGMLFPIIGIGAEASREKVGRYTSQGAGDASAEITPGKIVPEQLDNFLIGLNASWEVDIWKKLRNSRKAALSRYLGSVEGKNFVVTNLVSD